MISLRRENTQSGDRDTHSLHVSRSGLIYRKRAICCLRPSPSSLVFLILWMTRTVRPVIERFLLPESVQVGQRLSITCTVIKGDPPIAIRWMKDGVALQQQQQHPDAGFPQHKRSSRFGDSNVLHQLDSSREAGVRIHDLADFSSTLLFPAVQADHRGNYTCSASNAAGRDEYTSTLVICGEFPSLLLLPSSLADADAAIVFLSDQHLLSPSASLTQPLLQSSRSQAE